MTLISVAVILVLKIFNYKKRFLDAFNISIAKAFSIAIFLIITGASAQIYQKLFEMKLQKSLGLGYTNINFPDFIGDNILSGFFIICGLISGVLWLVAVFTPSRKNTNVDTEIIQE